VRSAATVTTLTTEDVLEVIGQDVNVDNDEDFSNINCCMTKRLSAEQDFRSEKPVLQQIIEDAGHICLFLPKYHCELNPIELYWAFTKRGTDVVIID
jgi:hypothetical protein